MMCSQQYDVWIVIAACGECVFQLTADLYRRPRFDLGYIYSAVRVFSSLSPSAARKHINPIFPFRSFCKAAIREFI